jgi:hypothetical protein
VKYPAEVLDRGQDLFDDVFLARLDADGQSFGHEEEHESGKRSGFGMLEVAGTKQTAQCLLHGFGETSIDRPDRIAQVGVGAAYNYQFEPCLVKGTVNRFPNEIDREGTAMRFDGKLLHLLPHFVEHQFNSNRCSTAFANNSSFGRKMVELRPARQPCALRDLGTGGVGVRVRRHTKSLHPVVAAASRRFFHPVSGGV